MNLIERVKNIITSPNKEWDVISTEEPNVNKIITGYVVPLAGAASIAAFIGYGLIGVSVFGFRVKGIDWGLYQAITSFIVSVGSVFITAFVVDALAPSFGSEKNFGRSIQLVAYSYTAGWLGGLLQILPVIALIGSLFGLYGLYLMYVGMPKLKKTPADKLIGYFVVCLVVLIAAYFVLGLILSAIIRPMMGLSYGTGGLRLDY
ncbi:MAG: YIP1 family protein [Bacteroidota bacterium]|nr:YIP1 family protein [Bacteroidota bacterium]